MNLVQAAGFPFSSAGLPKTWASFGAHSVKIDALFEMHRKNADAVVRATGVVLDGLNRMAKRQGELLAATVGEQIKVAHDVLTHGSFGENASNQVGAMRQLYVSNVSSFREQSDIAAETNIAVGDILSTRAIEALDEFGVLFGEWGAPSTASSIADAAVVPGHAARLRPPLLPNLRLVLMRLSSPSLQLMLMQPLTPCPQLLSEKPQVLTRQPWSRSPTSLVPQRRLDRRPVDVGRRAVKSPQVDDPPFMVARIVQVQLARPFDRGLAGASEWRISSCFS